MSSQSAPTQNLFDAALERELADPAFRDGFERKVAKINAIADLLSAMEEARARKQLSKVEVARRIERRPEAVSRLLAGKGQNPTLDTIADLAFALGLEVEVRIKDAPRRARRPHPPLVVHAAA